ncbi:hypothetical protein LCGC14_1544790 [marine sediment metagenome]|uniref:HTH arsR-type domain-containing protein n=1 Tax=marine sediment metagenome TaxID=412755 RepID=A0A0F9IRW5_9ZZZZ
MPDESDFKNFKTMGEFGKTVEGSRYLHNLYLKAVNHPIRREILEIINKVELVSKEDLIKILIDKDVVQDKSVFKYNIDYLIKALCIESVIDEKNKEIFYKITQSGKVIEYFK